MLTWLAELSPYFSPLNIFRYITFRTGRRHCYGDICSCSSSARGSSPCSA